jgi:hypothetical protein
MKAISYLILCCLGVALYSCKSERQQIVVPEEVIRQYQGFVDLNLYEDAKKLSTPAEQERLDMEAKLMAMESLDSTVFHTTFLKIDCKETGEEAMCRCIVEDEYGEYEMEFRLIKSGGVWLIDVPVEESDEGDSPSAPLGRMELLPNKL